MRVIFIFLAGFGLLFSALAQELPAVAVEQNPQREEVEPAVVVETRILPTVTTNKVLASQLSFLTDTAIQYADEGEYEEAEGAYLRALEADPENAEIRFRLSTIYLQMGRYTNAIPMLESLSNEFPNDATVHNNLSWSYATGAGVRNKEKALWHAREAILLAPFSPSMWNTLAEAYYAAGDYEKALRSADHALDLLVGGAPESPEIPAFQAQKQKVMRAKEAVEMLNSFGN